MKGSAKYLVLVIPVLALMAMPAMADNAFVGSKMCKKCHLKQHKSWGATAMATAFESLKPGVKAEEKTAAGMDPEKDYTADAACVGCHTTGYGMEGGFVSEADTPDLMGVGCESCHGAGGAYMADEVHSLKKKDFTHAEVEAAGMIVKVGEAQCVACHNEDNPNKADTFDFATQGEEGVHEHYDLKYEH